MEIDSFECAMDETLTSPSPRSKSPLPKPTADVRPGWLDFRLSLSSMLGLTTACCVLALLLRSAPESFWLRVGHLAVLGGAIIAAAASILVASLAFIMLITGVLLLTIGGTCKLCQWMSEPSGAAD